VARYKVKDDQIYTVQDIARLTGIDEGFVRRSLIDGRLVGSKFGRQWAVVGRDLRRWLRTRIRRTRADT
jgi:excisionase family DNA binding protein